MPLSREAIIISYRPINAEQCLFILEAIAEGVVMANIVEIETGIPDFQGLREEGIRYEDPVFDPRHGQKIGTISEILEKEKATCLEAAAAAAAAIRVAGRDAVVRLVPETDAYDKPIPWKYHAIVELPDGTFINPTQEIQEGAPVVGACCGSCAVGNTCESDCDHDHDHEHAPPEAGRCDRGRVDSVPYKVTQV